MCSTRIATRCGVHMDENCPPRLMARHLISTRAFIVAEELDLTRILSSIVCSPWMAEIHD